MPSTAGAMISKLADLQAWGTELAEGSLLTPETQARRLEVRRFDGQQINFGYGLGITGLNEFLGHDGAIFGYSSVVFTRPQTDTQIAFIANESTNSTTPTLTVALGGDPGAVPRPAELTQSAASTARRPPSLAVVTTGAASWSRIGGPNERVPDLGKETSPCVS